MLEKAMDYWVHSLFCLYLAGMRLFLAFTILCLFQSLACAQILVADEPLHHVIYEDTQVRVLEIVALPGDTAQMHQHDYNYCYIAVNGGQLWLEDLGEKSRTVSLPDHYCGGKFDLENNPFVHRFANIDNSEIRFFTIEHKSGLASPKQNMERVEYVILENDLFVVRKMEIPPLSGLQVRHNRKCFLLNLSGNPMLFSGDQAVSYWEHKNSDEKIQLSNLSDQAILIAVFEIY
jgi:hypothetical protein